MTCSLLDITCHVQGWFWGLVALVPWWVWLAALAAVALIVWRLGGWPGLVALAAGVGFLLGRRRPLDDRDMFETGERKPRRRSTTRKPPRDPPESLTR